MKLSYTLNHIQNIELNVLFTQCKLAACILKICKCICIISRIFILKISQSQTSSCRGSGKVSNALFFYFQ